MAPQFRCEICSILNKGQLHEGSEPYPFHQNFGSLVKAATDGCVLCKILVFNAEVQRWRETFVQDLLPLNTPPLFLRIEEADFLDDVSLSCFYNDTNGEEVKIAEAELNSEAVIHRPQDVAKHDIAKQWITTCSSSHASCTRIISQSRQDSAMPARLIKIEKRRGKLLCHLEQCMSEVKYAILSYRWGNAAHSMMTTSDNYDQRLIDIPVDEMPKTWRDAVELAVGIGLNHIWIDAMCIIQPRSPTDSRQDWQEQSAIMGQIYSGATITIAASSAFASSEGLFPNRSAIKFIPGSCRLFPGSGRGIPTVQPNLPGWENLINGSPLQERGWVLQERILSNRTIYCTAYGMFWQCTHLKSHETDPSEFYDGTKAMQGVSTFNDRNSSGPLRPPKTLHRNGHLQLKTDYWHGVAKDYSSRQLGVETDRFPALSAVARLIARLTNDTYVAGMWKETLVSQLFWFFTTDTGLAERIRQRRRLEPVKAIDNYVAPSWSWMSICYRFAAGRADLNWRMPSHFQSDIAEVVSIEMRPIFAANPFGQIENNARLTLKTKVPLFETKEWQRSIQTYGKDAPNPPSTNFDLEEYEDFHALLLRKDYLRADPGQSPTAPVCRGLALIPVDLSGNVFKRVGVFNWSNIDFFDNGPVREVHLI